jgi:SAM-dependent methyltransferase
VARLGFFSGWRILSHAFRRSPRRARWHVFGRYLTCPLRRVLEHLPREARLLDLGAGHGIFAHLALAAGARRAVALEPDRRKQFPPAARPGLCPVVGYAAAVAGTFDAVSILDVLYRLPADEWPRMLAAAHDRLRPGGVLLLKEIDPEDRLKGAWNRLQERLVDLVGLTLGDAFTYEPPGRMRERLTAAGFAAIETIPLGRGYPHAHVLYVARRGARPPVLTAAPSSVPTPPGSARPGT